MIHHSSVSFVEGGVSILKYIGLNCLDQLELVASLIWTKD
jgi:hypothetical protein